VPQTRETVYLIDTMAYVFRSFFGMRPMSAPDGTPINAVFGLGMTLQRLIGDHQPKMVACCFDAGAQTFRNEMYPAYKANRGAPPEELIPQFDLCRELTARMGVRASQITDLLALTGDAADNIPGVRGVGPKAATALLNEFENLEAIYADLDRVATLPVRGAGSLRRKLEEDRENALLSWKLVDLDRQAPCNVEIEDLAYKGAVPEEIEAFATRWGLGRVAQLTPKTTDFV
jgi:5'-3' exonuclease